MKRLYYEIWADAIEAMEKNTKSYMPLKDRIIYIYIVFSLAQGANLGLLMIILDQCFSIRSYFPFNIYFNLNNYLGDFFSGLVRFFLPFVILNYFLVSYKKTYLKYMDNRKVNTRGLALILYFVFSTGAYLIYVAIQKWVLN